MLARIAAFEFRYQLRNPVFCVTAGIFFLLTFGAMTVDQIQMGDGGNVHKNAPYATVDKHLILSLFFMFVTTAFVANVVVRDDDTGFGPIVRSTRISKFNYLLGRFIGAFLIAALAFAAVPLAIWFGSLMPWVDPETLGPNRLRDYLYAYFLIGVPNVLITSALFFALATATRSMMATYLGVIAFLIAWLASNAMVRDRPELEATVGMIEPFGIRAVSAATRYWTAAERNMLVPEFTGPLLYNRLLWIGLSLLFLALAYWSYRFAETGISKRKRRKQRIAREAPGEIAVSAPSSHHLPRPTFGAATARGQLWVRTRLEMKQVFRSPAFLVLIVFGLVNTIFAFSMGGTMFGTPTMLVTRSAISLLEGAFGIIPIRIAIYYGGELVWRERDRKIHEIIDSTPLPNWAYVIPKTAAVALVLFATLMIGVVAAILFQLLSSHTEVEFGKYLLWYVLPQTFDMTLVAILAVFVQALSGNKYLGWGVMVLYIITQIVFSSLSLDHNLYNYGGTSQTPYSDMNGAGGYWKAAWLFRLYWGAFAVLLLVGAHLLWRRGTETRLKPRLKRVPARLRGATAMAAGTALAVFLGTGAWAYYNTNILNRYETRADNERQQADLEKKFLPYEKLPQPTISHVQLNVALYPSETRAVTEGRYKLTNLTDQPIRDVHVRRGDNFLEILALELPGAKLSLHDKDFEYRIYRLAQPLAPGASVDMRFKTERRQRGFREGGQDTRLVRNGTFLNNLELAPQIGMNRMGLLQDRATRRKYGLPPEQRPAKLEDMSATRSSYFGGGWTTADITVSTVADQIPIAPGKKMLDRTENGRRTARFVSDAPILTFFSVQSAKYAEKHRQHAGVDLAIYYHPEHHWNVDRMLNALQTSLDYYQANFGPYQFDQARIIEFPAYATFAQAFANTMPYSEAIGFVADTSDPDKIDYVTYVTAHELGHQYWAHQVIGADMQGGTMLSETLAQYSALMVMKKLYGEDKIRRFLKYELDNYLRMRGGDVVEELPLARVENQQYIHYNKGSLAMYLLQERLGEDAVNRALRSLLDKYKFKGAPYPRSLDLVQAFRVEAKTPEQQALITDLFERITVYDMKVAAPTAVRRADGRWDVSVPVEARKFYADGQGNEKEARLAEPVEIGLFSSEPGRGAFAKKDVISMERQPVRSGKQVLKFVTAKKPAYAGVDPYNFYIDRNSADNVLPVS